MKTPIAYALSYPERLPLDLPPLDLCHLGKLTFREPDSQRFPCLALAYQALAAGNAGSQHYGENAFVNFSQPSALSGVRFFLGAMANVIRIV